MTGEADASVTIYDKSLSEDIYEYARIWTCKQCTFINFDKDEKCELCTTPRHRDNTSPAIKLAPNGMQGPRKNKNDSINSAEITGDSWVCKTCTYFNLEKTDRCLLCNSSKENSANAHVEWSCGICSHKNGPTRDICEVCSNGRDHEPMDFETSTNQYDNNSRTLKKQHHDDGDDDIEDIYYPRANTSNAGGDHGTANTSRASTMNLSLTYRSQKSKSVINTYAKATCQAERTWNSILKYCKENNIKFVDDSFPPCDKSLFIGGFLDFRFTPLYSDFGLSQIKDSWISYQRIWAEANTLVPNIDYAVFQFENRASYLNFPIFN